MLKVIVFPLLVIVLILIFRSVRGGSKIERVIAEIAVLVVVGLILAAIAIPQYASRRRRGYDADVKANIRNAATAQEAYYKVNGTYTANIGNLKGFNQSANVNITMEATATMFVITGTKMKGCKAGTGTWFISSTTGAINGTPCG